MIRRLAVTVLAAFLAATVSLATPAFSDNSRPTVGGGAAIPRVSCEAVQTDTGPTLEARRLARRLDSGGAFRQALKIQRQRDRIVELKERIAELKAAG